MLAAIAMQQILLISLLFLISACTINDTEIVTFPHGGYGFPNTVEKKDTALYIYPVKDILSSQDSFKIAYYSEYLYKSFDEPNLSLYAPKKPVFRLVYFQGFTGYIAILTLEEKKLVIKEPLSGCAFPCFTYEKEAELDSIEKLHYGILRNYFPLNNYQGNAWRKKYLDSLCKRYPQLLDPGYYHALVDKVSLYEGEDKFNYKRREMPISQKQYVHFIDRINQSGYWTMKPLLKDCAGESTHADGYSLEAATSHQYNFVLYNPCGNALTNVTIELMEFAGVFKDAKEQEQEIINKR